MASENRNRIIKMSRERILQMERKTQVRKIVDAIGDRRIRDVIDLIALYEQTYNWNYAINCLFESKNMEYTSPTSAWGKTIRIEPLKYREIIFEIFSCHGFEGIPVLLSDIFKLASEAESHSSATRFVTQFIVEKTEEHLNMGGTLFLSIDNQHNVPSDIRNHFLRILNEQIAHIKLSYHQELINIINLWYAELGRRTLSDFGVKGSLIEPELFESVLSVLPVSKVLKQHLKASISYMTHNNGVGEVMTTPEYQKLLELIIKQDLEGIMKLGSKYAVPTVNYITKTKLDKYRSEALPENFYQLLKCLDTHLAIRHINSISTLEEIASLNDPRLAQLSIKTLGHYYHESAVDALLEIICMSKNKEYLLTANASIIKLARHLPEVIKTLNKFLETFDCRHFTRVKQLLKDLEKHRY